MPPPSSGGIAIAQVFGMIDHLSERHGFEMPPAGFPDSDDAHLLIEAMKHAFADRARHLADPAFADLPIEQMLDARNIGDAAARIDPDAPGATADYGVHRPGPAGPGLPEDGGTSHISVVDAMGNAVACTETINLSFGSMIAAEGFCLNNEMDDFTTVRGATNAFGLTQSDDNLPEPGKRPLSSMSPAIVLDADGSPFAVAGASGGPRIITATAQSLLRVLLADAGAAEAVGAPRLHHQWQPDAVYFETGGFVSRDDAEGEALRDALARLGHTTRQRTDIGACQLIRRTRNGRYEAASDPRKGGRSASAQTRR
jgi:gamma-glutamyltranspeptidase/glutathione hydrolase